MVGLGDMGAGGLSVWVGALVLSLRYFLVHEQHWDAAPQLTRAYCFIGSRAWRAGSAQPGQLHSVFPKRVALLER